MPGNGIDWEGLTGKPIDDITLDDKLTIMIGKLINIEKRIAKVPVMEVFYKVMSPVIVTILIAILLLVINHISHAG